MTLTMNQVTDAVILYTIVQTFWWLLKTAIAGLSKVLTNERVRLIKQHIRAGHIEPLKYCTHADCQPLRHL